MSLFQNTSVNVLTGADFQENPLKLQNNDCVFILFFAPWCGHCQNFKPEYIKFADIAQFMKVAAVDCDEEKTLTNKLKITGFPTVKIYCCGKYVSDYNGPRTVDKLMEKARSVCDENCKCDLTKKLKMA